MRAWKITLSVVLAAFLAMGAAEASYAVPSVVDQYTEQVPSPGGDVPNDPPPKNVPKPTPPPSGNGSNTTNTGGDTSGVVNVAPETGAAQPSTGGSSADRHKKARHAHKSEKQNGSEHQADRDQSQIKLGSIGPASGADRGDGMGWLFPAALVAMAAVMVGGIVARRRREGGGSA